AGVILLAPKALPQIVQSERVEAAIQVAAVEVFDRALNEGRACSRLVLQEVRDSEIVERERHSRSVAQLLRELEGLLVMAQRGGRISQMPGHRPGPALESHARAVARGRQAQRGLQKPQSLGELSPRFPESPQATGQLREQR